MSKAKLNPASKPKNWPLSKIIPYPNNPRTHPAEQITLLAQMFLKYGIDQPIVVDEDGIILKGHGRRLAAVEARMESFPVVQHLGLSEDDKRAIRVSDNQVQLLSGWDENLLRIELMDLKTAGYDLPLLGFNQVQLVSFMANVPTGDPDKIPDIPIDPVSKPGDLWLLGKHRLLCGDCTKSDNIQRLMNGERANLFATDPPYAVGYLGGKYPGIKGSNPTATKNKDWSKVYHEADVEDGGNAFYNAFIKTAISHAITENAAWYCWHASMRARMVETVWIENGAFSHQQIIWKKSRAVLTHSVYLWEHEPCLMGWIRGKKPFSRTTNLDFNTSVWDVPNSEIESNEHPTSKPIKLFTVPMLVHTQINDLCFEPFSGSGSQIIAAESVNRRCYATEISPQFVDVGVQRWQEYVDAEATLDGDGRTFYQVMRARKKAPRRNGASRKVKKSQTAK